MLSITKTLRGLFARPATPSRPRSARRPLRLECLEERTLLCNPGELDLTFDTDGKVTTDFGGAGEYAASVAVQADGKIVAGGTTPGGGLPSKFALARYNTNGSLDSSFGSGGKVITSVSPKGGSGELKEILIQPDGMIIAAGITVNGGWTAPDFVVVRYKADGSLDNSFGSKGKVTTGFGVGSEDRVRDAVLQPDGKIVVVGWTSNGSTQVIAAARYNPNGTLDTTFSGDGKMTTALARAATGVALQADGKIILAGTGFTLVRLNVNGSVDTSFGAGGAATAPLNGNALAVAIQQDGKFVAAGFSYDANGVEDHALARYNTDGSLDTTFDGDGLQVVSVISNDHDSAQDLAIQSDGKIVTAGRASGSTAILRFNSDGSLDSGFGTGGVVTTANGGGADMAIQSDGKIVSAGSADNSDFALARYCA